MKVMTIYGDAELNSSVWPGLFTDWTNCQVMSAYRPRTHRLEPRLLVVSDDLGIGLLANKANIETSSRGVVCGGALVVAKNVMRVNDPDAVLVLVNANFFLSALNA